MNQTAKCLDMWYVRGEHLVTTHDRFRGLPYNFHDRGTGWGERVIPSRLVLEVEINGQREEIWIDRFFKTKVGKLTEKRRDVIRATMPLEVKVEEHVGRKGSKYFTLLESELATWLQRTGLV